MGNERMPTSELDHTTASRSASHAPSDLPCLVQLLPRQAAGMADGSSYAVKQRFAGEPRQVERGEA